MAELEQIVLHLIDREYAGVVDQQLPIAEKIVLLAREFRGRLTILVANWIRVGYCQGNFNSDNCAAGGFTLDYGPFGFCEVFDPYFQPWTGGGEHYAFLNQPAAAQRNFMSFCVALQPLLAKHPQALQQLDAIQRGFPAAMQAQMDAMWAAKLGLGTFNEALFNELVTLMMQTSVDYTVFFRELSALPDDISALKKSFYSDPTALDERWAAWFAQWKMLISNAASHEALSARMKRVNPKYSWREWFVVPAYKAAAERDYTLVRELQEVLTQPYAEQSQVTGEKYYKLKPAQFFAAGGTSHYSCSS
jgi:uncharacterized protein YdiU (UPF0061 family)